MADEIKSLYEDDACEEVDITFKMIRIKILLRVSSYLWIKRLSVQISVDLGSESNIVQGLSPLRSFFVARCLATATAFEHTCYTLSTVLT